MIYNLIIISFFYFFHINAATTLFKNSTTDTYVAEDSEGIISIELDELINQTLQYNPQLYISQHRINESYWKSQEALSEFKPQLNLEVGHQQINKDLASIGFSLYPQKESSVQAQASLLIFSLPSYHSLSATKKNIIKESIQYNDDRNSLIYSSAQSFINCLKTQALQERVLYELEYVQGLLQLATDRLESGLGSNKDIYRLHSQKSQVQRQYDQQENLRQQALNTLLKIANIDCDCINLNLIDYKPLNQPQPSTVIEMFADCSKALEFESEFKSKVISSSTIIQSLQSLLSIQTSHLKAIKSSFWSPEVYFEGGYKHDLNRSGAGSSRPEGKRNYNWMAGFKASIPLTSGGKRSSKLHQIQESIQQIKYMIQQAELSIQEQISDSISNLKTTANAYLLSEQSSKYSLKTLQTIENEYAQGILPLIELTEARKTHLVDTLDTISSKYDYLNALIRIQFLIQSYEFIDSESYEHIIKKIHCLYE